MIGLVGRDRRAVEQCGRGVGDAFKANRLSPSEHGRAGDRNPHLTVDLMTGKPFSLSAFTAES